jgi:protein HIRA/HIR1
MNVVEGRNWQEDSKTICGWPREELLRDVVLILGKHRDLQRIIVPFAKMLHIVDGEVEDQDAMAS